MSDLVHVDGHHSGADTRAASLPVAAPQDDWMRALAAQAAVPENADAELIRLCSRLATLHAEEAALYAADDECPDMGPLKPKYDALQQEWRAVAARLQELPLPSGVAGAGAMARAALVEVPRDHDGKYIARGFSDWLILSVVEWVASVRLPGSGTPPPAIAA